MSSQDEKELKTCWWLLLATILAALALSVFFFCRREYPLGMGFAVVVGVLFLIPVASAIYNAQEREFEERKKQWKKQEEEQKSQPSL